MHFQLAFVAATLVTFTAAIPAPSRGPVGGAPAPPAPLIPLPIPLPPVPSILPRQAAPPLGPSGDPLGDPLEGLLSDLDPPTASAPLSPIVAGDALADLLDSGALGEIVSLPAVRRTAPSSPIPTVSAPSLPIHTPSVPGGLSLPPVPRQVATPSAGAICSPTSVIGFCCDKKAENPFSDPINGACQLVPATDLPKISRICTDARKAFCCPYDAAAGGVKCVAATLGKSEDTRVEFTNRAEVEATTLQRSVISVIIRLTPVNQELFTVSVPSHLNWALSITRYVLGFRIIGEELARLALRETQNTAADIVINFVVNGWSQLSARYNVPGFLAPRMTINIEGDKVFEPPGSTDLEIDSAWLFAKVKIEALIPRARFYARGPAHLKYPLIQVGLISV
ncbi:hypothetical protein BDP27DRAFT_1406825 [Rhodocollybia butyracea]|uniref:Uncharacterized protein n=1 Tax=Rhodocollybia butyracea TaxID=206335 RepID=A0A9P5U129_9AGAR|nr:hypothetical protein BDP27DRAFT_1406825 [Rhodocollybia butyracea]